jgi:hypothetical protein
LSGRDAGAGVELLAGPLGVLFLIEAVTDKATCAGIGNAIPNGGIGRLMTNFSGSAAMDNDFVATLHDKNVFHGATAAVSYSEQL